MCAAVLREELEARETGGLSVQGEVRGDVVVMLEEEVGRVRRECEELGSRLAAEGREHEAKQGQWERDGLQLRREREELQRELDALSCRRDSEQEHRAKEAAELHGEVRRVLVGVRVLGSGRGRLDAVVVTLQVQELRQQVRKLGSERVQLEHDRDVAQRKLEV